MKKVNWYSWCHLVWVGIIWMAGWSYSLSLDHHHLLRDLHEESHVGKGKICQSLHIRFLNEFKALEGCTVIEGFLHLNLWLEEREVGTNITFPELREVTGFVMAFYDSNTTKIMSLKTLFPNLAVIRGQELVESYALIIYKMKDLQEIGLPSLTNILRGSVWIVDNQNLCYVDTVDWSKIANDSNTRGIMDNKLQCPDTCPQCPKSDIHNDRHLCWSTDHCQVVPQITCPQCGGRPCFGSDKQCCHPQCLGGCDGPGPSNCFVCKGVVINNPNGQDSYCTDKCPHGYYEYLHRRCLSKDECLNITVTPMSGHPQNVTRTGKLYVSENGETLMCVLECPKNTELAPNGTACILCNGTCKRNCEGRVVDSIEAARELAGCTRITGPLKIHIRRSSATTSSIFAELRENLDKIEEIDHYLAVTYTYSIYSLDFLPHLKLIRGTVLDDKKYALIVKSNDNLMELWNGTSSPNRQTITIENKNARVLFHYNPKLCPAKIWEFVRQAGIRLPAPDDNIDIGLTNGDKAPCNTSKLALEVLSKSNATVVLQWTNFRKNLTLPSHLLNYEIHYKEALNYPSENVSKVEGRDPCGDDGWNVQEQAKISDSDFLSQESEPQWENEALIANLKPFTQYAVYVKAIVIPDVHFVNQNAGAESDIVYFRTLADIPRRPMHFRLASSGPNRVTVSWEPPDVSNGELESFKIWMKSVPEVQSLQDQRNYCEEGRSRKVNSPVIRGPDSLFTTTLAPMINQGQDCCSCSATPKPSRDKQAEDVYAKSTMMDLITGIYALPSYGGGADLGSNGLINAESPLEDDPKQNEIRKIRRRRWVREERSVTPSSSTSAEATEPEMFPPEVFPEHHQTINSGMVTFPGMKEGMELVKEVSYNSTLAKYTFVLPNLTHYTTYFIGIQACRKIDSDIKANDTRTCSEYIEERVQTALDPIADYIDPKTVALNVTGSQLHVRWGEPSHPNGVVMAYVIVLQKVGAAKEEFWDKKCITHADFQKNGKNYTYPAHLAPGNYSVKIQVASLAQDSEFTAVQYFIIEDLGGASTGFLMLVVLLPTLALVCLFGSAGYWVLRKHYAPGHLVISANPEYMPNVDIAEEWEVPRDKVILLELLGNGSFGAVYKGKLLDFIPDLPEVLCAVKTVADDTPGEERALFLREAALMTKLSCHHVVKLLGIVSKTQPIFVIMELMENGDLKNYLRSRRPDAEKKDAEPPPTLKQILRIAAEVADGMAYIHSQRLVHRDIAARNCLVHKDLTVKVGDFGMTKEITDYYRKQTRGLLPVRWMAPESLRDGVFTSQSDVWSFGVVLWEMATLGAQPYQGLSNSQVLDFVQSGRVMDPPEKCPSILYELMTDCWKYDHRHRPTFFDILDRLTSFLEPSFAQISFYHSPEGVQYKAQASLRPAEEEPAVTIRTPLIATFDMDDDDDIDYESDEDNHPLGHHIIDDLEDSPSRRLLNNLSVKPSVEPSTSPSNKSSLENGVALSPLSISGSSGSYLRNGSSSAQPTVPTASSNPSSLFSNPPLRSSLTSQAPTNSYANNNYTEAVFTTNSTSSPVSGPNYSMPLTPVKVNEVRSNPNNKSSQNRSNTNRSPVTYTSVTPVSQNTAQNKTNSGSGVESNESSKSYSVNCAGDSQKEKVANGSSTGGNGFILPYAGGNRSNKTTQF